MKAIVCPAYGGPEVLQLTQLPIPQPAPNEVLVQIKATAVTAADWRLRAGQPAAARLFFGLTKPKYRIPGGIFAGTVVAAGASVARYKTGDNVYGSCALQYGFGAYAEYKTLPEDGVFCPMPKDMSFTDAATLPFGGMTALHFVQAAQLKAGERVLISGASGAVGNMILQLAKYHGAHITATANTHNLLLLQQLGADKVMSYTGNELATCNDQYDVIFDTAGKTPVSLYKKKLKPGGRLVLVAADIGQMMGGMLLAMRGKLKLSAGMARETYDHMRELTRLANEGYVRAVVDQIMPLEAIAEAHRLTQSGQKTGTIAISFT